MPDSTPPRYVNPDLRAPPESGILKWPIAVRQIRSWSSGGATDSARWFPSPLIAMPGEWNFQTRDLFHGS